MIELTGMFAYVNDASTPALDCRLIVDFAHAQYPQAYL